MRGINVKGLNLLKEFEKCRLTSYKDACGVWTIGWGSTGPDVKEGMSMTQEQADALFLEGLAHFYGLEGHLTRPCSDNQYAAMICLAYNIGLEAFINSHVLSFFNAGLPVDGAWKLWTKGHVNGQLVTIPGLVNRREAELKLFHDTED